MLYFYSLFLDRLYSTKKNEKAKVDEKYRSNGTTNDSVWGYIKYKIIRTKKNSINVTTPANPTLPDLYQLNLLY